MAEAKWLYESAPKKPMDKLTKEQTVEFVTAKECHICFKKFSPKGRKVRDHTVTTLVNIEELLTLLVT